MTRRALEKPTETILVAVLLAALSVPALGHPEHGADDGGIVKHPSETGNYVRLDDVDFSASGTVTGILVNRSGDILRDVRLLVRYNWHWRNELEPGDDSPARSSYFTIAKDVPALGTVPFRYTPSPPLPIRADGHFSPSIEVARYTQVRLKKVLRKIER